ncbi:MAG: beta-galactosidase, partial [Candidatus Acidiferrales bacterium]
MAKSMEMCRATTSRSRIAHRRPHLPAFCTLLAPVLCVFLAASGFAAGSQDSPAARKNAAETEKTPTGVEIVQHGSYPELRVDGRPFFIHSAAFYYYRIPRDQWESLLERYRSLGINTIDIYIPWNWHEPQKGQFDFDGHTNPRRNLRALLAIVAQKHLRLIARPGPEILNEWRNGGIPGWLLAQPEFKMNAEDLIEGRYAPLDGLSARDSEAAAHAWLANPSYMDAAHAWFAAVARELAPYNSHRMVSSPTDNPESLPVEHSGPLLFVQIGDDFAINRTNRVGPDFWKFVESMRADLQNQGLDVPVFINPTDMRVTAAGSTLAPPIGAMGQWYLRPGENASSGKQRINAHDALEIQFFTEELKTQPDFPPVMIEYQAGWYAPGDDDHPADSVPSNTLLSSRLLIANGIHGINYFPLQDTYTPAGYSVPWANRSYRWNAALGPDGDEQPRLRAVLRNSQFLDRWAALLAACHKRADFGILYPLGAFPQDRLSSQDIERVSQTVMRIERLAMLGMYSSELLDPQYQPLEQLLRDPILLLPVFDPGQPQFQLSEEAQQKIVEYVLRGGSLVVFPVRPTGKIIDGLWQAAPVSPENEPVSESAIRRQWKFGQGEIIESSKDFYSWLGLDKSFEENHAQPESEYAVAALREFLWAARLRPILQISGKTAHAGNMIADELVSNEGTGALGERKDGEGFLSVTNLDDDSPAEATLDVLSPAISARGKTDDYTGLHVIVPPHESLLLPLNIPLCFEDPANVPCGDSVRASGAEFVDAEREDRT